MLFIVEGWLKWVKKETWRHSGLVGRKIVDYMEFNQSLKKVIAAFRHSTPSETIIVAMKSGELTLMVLTDYSKAFDTVPYSVVIQKMFKLGLSNSFLY